MPRGSDGGEDPTVDLVVLSGLRSRVSTGAWGRPISQRAVEKLIAALNRSPLASFLDSLVREFERDTIYFHHEGLNRSSVANLVWRELGDPNPFEIRAHIEVPGQYGQMHVGSLAFTITVTSRLTAFLGAAYPPPLPSPSRRRLDVAEWAALLDSVAGTLVDDEVISPLADIAGVEAIEIRQPGVLHIVSGPPITDLLPQQLSAIPGTGVSHGAHMLVDPALDLSDAAERASQVDQWLCQMAIDAGRLGMDQLVNRLRGRPD